MKRKGVHPPEFIRPMLEQDADALIGAHAGVMVVTLAPACGSMRSECVLSVPVSWTLTTAGGPPCGSARIFGGGGRERSRR